jgi:hypothetical protein
MVAFLKDYSAGATFFGLHCIQKFKTNFNKPTCIFLLETPDFEKDVSGIRCLKILI